MANHIRISAEFSYQGQIYQPEIKVDLDNFIKTENFSDLVIMRLAKENCIDTYSYQYEVLQQSLLKFDQAEGLIKQYINNGTLDYTGFIQAHQEHAIFQDISLIAKEHLDIDDLNQHPQLIKALTASYLLAK